MSRHDEAVYLRHMLDFSAEAMALLRGKSRADLDSDRTLNLAVVRLLELIGEAAHRVSPETRNRFGDIPWRQVVSMRNHLIHGYDAIDFDIVWQVVQEDLPHLAKSLRRVLE